MAPRFSAAQHAPVLAPVKVVPRWTGPAPRRNMAAIGKHGQARSANSKCSRFQGNPALKLWGEFSQTAPLRLTTWF
jgi:hypothetical protein